MNVFLEYPYNTPMMFVMQSKNINSKIEMVYSHDSVEIHFGNLFGKLKLSFLIDF